MSDSSEPRHDDWRLLRRVVTARATRPPAVSASAAIDAVHRRIAAPDLGARTARSSLRAPWLLGASGLVAAAALAAAFGLRRVPAAPTPARVYATHAGQRATIPFAGGRITLAPMSTLRLSAREAVLVGQAYFEIENSRTSPFAVRTGGVVTRVLGTAFDVTRYASDTVTRVAVTTGKVSVTADAARGVAPRGALIVAAGGVGRVGDSTATLLAGERAADVADWTRDRLVFRHAPVDEVLATVTRWYGYEFRVADSTLTHERVTTVLVRSSTADALTTLKIVLGVDMRFDGRVITLVPKKHPRAERRESDDEMSHPSTLAAGV